MGTTIPCGDDDAGQNGWECVLETERPMAFDRKDYGMNKGIPLVKIADRVEVRVDLVGRRVSGSPVVFKQ